MEGFRDRLRTLMEENEMSVYSLSRATEITETTISRLLRGDNNPSQATLIGISEYFKVNIPWLEKGLGDRERAGKSEERFSTIGDRVKTLFRAKRVNTKELMEKLGYSRQVYYNIIGNNANPSAEFIAKLIVEFSDLNAGWLLTGVGEMFVEKNADQINHLPPAIRREALRQLQVLDFRSDAGQSEPFVSSGSNKMEHLIKEIAEEISDIQRTKINKWSKEDILEFQKNSIRDLWLLSKEETEKAKSFFDEMEFIKSEGTNRFFSLGQGLFLVFTILVRESEVNQYLPNYQNSQYLSDFSKHVVTINKLFFDEYRSFEVGAHSLGGSCARHMVRGDVVTGKKLNHKSGRHMEFIQGSECVLVFQDRIIFTQITGWDAIEGHILYEDPQKRINESHINDLLEIYSIEVVTQSRN